MDLTRKDLESYFTRIKYFGLRVPTIEVLRDLQYRHALTFPFENVDVLVGRPIKLDTGSLTDKLIAARRGGYCFEQNGLFWRVLTTLGFAVSALAARVRWMVPDDVPTGRTHMLLRVDLGDGPYIVDVGFGGMNPTAPFAFVCDIEQPTHLDAYRIVRWGEDYELQARLGVAWGALYRFTLEPQTLSDYEIYNWFVSTSPKSRFVQNLTLALPTEDRRLTLFNDRFTIRHRDGSAVERTLDGVEDLISTVRQYFDLDLDRIAGAEGMEAIVERCFPAGQNRVL